MLSRKRSKKNYSCNLCNYDSPYKADLRIHHLTGHTDLRPPPHPDNLDSFDEIIFTRDLGREEDDDEDSAGSKKSKVGSDQATMYVARQALIFLYSL